MASPTLLYEVWELDFNKTAFKKKWDGGLKFLRSAAGYTTCDHKTNEEIREKLNTYN